MSPQVTTQHYKGQAEIFKNPFLESLTKTNPTSNIIIYGITVLSLIYMALFVINIPLYSFLILFFGGLFFWTLAEYILHRSVFHWINENKAVQRFHFVIHGNHHLYPKDTDRILMPPVPGLLMGFVLLGMFYLIFAIIGYPDSTWGFFPGFFLGYLLYSFVHRATHVNKPLKRFKYLWKHHSLHHYKYPDKAFGVSNIFWDRIFGTMPPK